MAEPWEVSWTGEAHRGPGSISIRTEKPAHAGVTINDGDNTASVSLDKETAYEAAINLVAAAHPRDTKWYAIVWSWEGQGHSVVGPFQHEEDAEEARERIVEHYEGAKTELLHMIDPSAYRVLLK